MVVEDGDRQRPRGRARTAAGLKEVEAPGLPHGTGLSASPTTRHSLQARTKILGGSIASLVERSWERVVAAEGSAGQDLEHFMVLAPAAVAEGLCSSERTPFEVRAR